MTHKLSTKTSQISSQIYDFQSKKQLKNTPPFKTNFIFFVTIKPRYSSFFSIGPKDFKNVIFEKIGWALFEVAEVAHMKLSRIKKLKALCSKNFSKLAQKRYFCICDLEAAHLTSMTSEGAQWIFMKITFLKSGNYAEKNELSHAFIAGFIKNSVFYHVASRSLEGIVEN